MNPELLKIARDLERQGLKLEAAAVRAVAAAYGQLTLNDLFALLQMALDTEDLTKRVAAGARLMEAFRAAAGALQVAPDEMRTLLADSVKLGATQAQAMIVAAGNPAVLAAFSVRPTRAIEFANHAATRLTNYWGMEQSRLATQVQGVIVEALERGQSIQQAQMKLRETVNVSKKRATLIVRNEIATASATAVQATQTDLGIEEYIWVTAHDDRVRPEHKARDGKTFRWDTPPKDGHPGQPIQCRCVAVAVIP
jgi:SPP1 gp7 family putative phage head morphogenesis protein